MKNNFWETGTFFGVPASFFYPGFVADSSRICGVLCGFIGEFGRFYLDESEEFIKMDNNAHLDKSDTSIKTNGKFYADEKNLCTIKTIQKHLIRFILTKYICTKKQNNYFYLSQFIDNMSLSVYYRLRYEV